MGHECPGAFASSYSFVNEIAIVRIPNISLSRRFIFLNRLFLSKLDKKIAKDSTSMDRNEMQELCEAQVQILQRMAGIKDCREDLAALQAANAVQKNRIADQDARALLMEAEHTQYVQKMERSFSSMQADMQAFMGLNAQTVTLQVNSYQQSLSQQRDAHLEAVRALTESCNAKVFLAEEQCKLARLELQDLLAFKSRTTSHSDAPNMWSENEDEDDVPS
jgi:hypothetical protein